MYVYMYVFILDKETDFLSTMPTPAGVGITLNLEKGTLRLPGEGPPRVCVNKKLPSEWMLGSKWDAWIWDVASQVGRPKSRPQVL